MNHRGRSFATRALVVGIATALALIASACSSAQVAAPVIDIPPTVTGVEPTAAPPPTAVPDPAKLPIVVGVAMAETGVMAEFDRPALAGMQWQVEQINDRGGVLGRDLVLDVRDTMSRMSVTKQVARELTDSGIGALFVTCDADFARPAIDEANARGILTISPCGTDLLWDASSLGPLSFSFGNSAFLEGAAMAGQAIDDGQLSAVLFIDTTNPPSVDQCRGFADTYPTLGGTVLADYSYSFAELAALEQRLTDQPVPAASVVVLCTHLPGGLAGGPDTIDLLRMEFGVTAPALVGSALDAPGWLRSALEPGQVTIVTVASVFGDDPSARVNQMVADLDDQNGLSTRGWTALGADAIEGFAIALERAGELQGIFIAQQLEQFLSEDLVTGGVTISAEHHMQPNRILRVLKADGDNVRFAGTRSGQ